MVIKYLGTAAAEGWPALFCKCPACEKARGLGGKNIRSRSQAIIDGSLLVDFPPDTYMHSVRGDVDIPSVENLIVTHSHEDHFYPLDLLLRSGPYGHNFPHKVLNVYGNIKVKRLFHEAVARYGSEENYETVQYHMVQPFVPFNVGEYTVTALLADHQSDETSFIYIIEKDGKSILYGNDTGYFPEATWDYIKDKHFDCVSLDCTYVLLDNMRGHMGLPNNILVKNRMLELGCADDNTTFIVVHFSHNGNSTHEEVEAEASKHGFLTAYDGFEVKF